MYLTLNQVSQRFTRISKGKIYEKMKANDIKSYLHYLNKLVDQDNNTYHCSTGEKPIGADYSVLTEDIKSNHKVPKFKVGDRVSIAKYKNVYSKGYTKNWSREIFVIDSMLKTNPCTYKIKDLNKEKITGSFY